MDNKSLKKIISDEIGKTGNEVDLLITGLINVIKDRCADMDSIAVPGFGLFEPRKRLERVNVHPSTGKRILIPHRPFPCLHFSSDALLRLREPNQKEHPIC